MAEELRMITIVLWFVSASGFAHIAKKCIEGRNKSIPISMYGVMRVIVF